METPSFYSDPQVTHLVNLLDDIGRGFLQVPRFQRPLSWDVDRQLELLRSVRSGVPCGAIMVWRSNRDDLSVYDHLGPYQLPPPPRGASRQYILDGVQRLSTLYGALRFPRPRGVDTSAAAESYEFFFDFEEDDFIAEKGKLQLELFPNDLVGESSRLPVRFLLDSMRLIPFQRRLKGAHSEARIATSDHLAEMFRSYKIAILPITTDDLNLATRTFQLINSQGIPMGEMDMIHALTYSPGFELREHMEARCIQELGPIGWTRFKLDPDWILKACKAAVGQHMYRADLATFSSELRGAPETLDRTVANLRRAFDFLSERCVVTDLDLLPYPHQLLMLAEVFRVQPQPGEELLDRLEAWFWISTYGTLFTNITGDRIQFTLAKMRDMLHEPKLYWTGHAPFSREPLLQRFNWANVRARALALRLGARHERGRETLARYGRQALQHLIPRADLEDPAMGSSSANHVLVALEREDKDHGRERDKGDPSQRRKPIEMLREHLLHDKGAPAAEILQMHAISEEALHALRQGDYRGFLERRWQTLEADEAAHLDSIQQRFPLERA
jgi:Protein of unknown function DUF262